MNHSIYGADRATHSKIVTVALLAATAVSSLAVSLHAHSRAAPIGKVAVFKPGKPTVIVGSTIVAAR